jgi:hypothetical protein
MTAQRNINLQVLRPLRVPVPALDLQARFQEVRRRTHALGIRLESTESQLDSLFGSLAQRAFAG